MDTQAPQTSDPTSSQAPDKAKEHKYLLLLISILVLAFLLPIHRELKIAKLALGESYVNNVLFVVVMMAGFHSVCRHHLLKLLGTGLWIGALVSHTVGKAVLATKSASSLLALGAADTMFLVGMITLTWLILLDLFRPGRDITADRLRGAACAYLLMGLAWALAYRLVERLIPGSFAGLATVKDDGMETAQMVYYSFVTLTTLGYGDITPVRPLAETLSFLEAFVGQFYLTVLVAFLVGQRLAVWIAQSRS